MPAIDKNDAPVTDEPTAKKSKPSWHKPALTRIAAAGLTRNTALAEVDTVPYGIFRDPS